MYLIDKKQNRLTTSDSLWQHDLGAGQFPCLCDPMGSPGHSGYGHNLVGARQSPTIPVILTVLVTNLPARHGTVVW